MTSMRGRRNAGLAVATGVTAGLLFLYPTSLGHSVGLPAAAGTVVTASTEAVADTSVNPSATTTTTGTAAQTRWGPVQVQIQVANGRLVSSQAIVYPQENRRDVEINAYAVPALNAAALAAQSADVDTISGATYTSDGYRESLQAALDAAHLG